MLRVFYPRFAGGTGSTLTRNQKTVPMERRVALPFFSFFSWLLLTKVQLASKFDALEMYESDFS